jgi:hypothetical protein
MEFSNIAVVLLVLVVIGVLFQDDPTVKVIVEVLKDLYAKLKKFVCDQCSREIKVETITDPVSAPVPATNTVIAMV